MRKLYIHEKKAFTLIELLVVIAIIGVLAAILTAALSTARGKGRDTQRISDIRQLQNALQLQFSVGGTYPATLAPLASSSFIPKIPTDPLGTSYSYIIQNGGSQYHLGASLEQLNVVLKSDADYVSSGGFSGSDTTPCSSSDKGLYCYDIHP